MIKVSLFISLFSALSILAYSQATRGRVLIQNGTLITDKGTLLRGAYISTDAWSYIPSEAQITAIKNLGLNCVHLYGECRVNNFAGENFKAIDSIVNMTERDSLYLVLTIGGCGEEGSFDSAFVNDFWKFYAPRYKDRTHVIYEIMNEPFAWTPPYDSVTLAMERRAYDTIHHYAPESHILFMSYSGATDAKGAIQDIKKLGEGIDWNHAAIATHGYGVASEELRNFLSTIIDSGYAIINTEPVSIGNKYVNLATTRVFEEESVSYLHFIYIPTLLNEKDVFIDPFEQSEIRWVPDFGIWPLSLTEIKYKDPYVKFVAGFYDEGSGFNLLNLDTRIGNISNNDYIGYYNFNFENSPDSIIVTVSCGNTTQGNMYFYLDSLDGQLIGSCNISYTGGWNIYKRFSFPVNITIEGVHKFYYVFQSNDEYGGMNLESLQFMKNSNSSINNKLSESTTVCIYPNPAKDQISITTKEKAFLEIYTLFGQLAKQKEILEFENTIDIDDLNHGCYLLHIINENYSFSEILIIE